MTPHFVPDTALWIVLWILVLLIAAASLTVVILGDRLKSSLLLYISAGLLVLDLAIVAVTSTTAPPVISVLLVLVGLALAVLGGSPVTRLVLSLSGGAPDTGAHGGIIPSGSNGGTEVLRGGRTIGYLERTATAAAIIAGFPEALAIVVAVKGVGRFTELGEAETRERFIIGTLASLLWACLAGGLVRLAIS
jgi:hypothetical protein